jgi:two-component system phosphate regulon response regulator PhoB
MLSRGRRPIGDKVQKAEIMNARREEAKCVLIVDDDEALAAALVEALRQHGMAADMTARGEDALRIAANAGPDVILLGDRLRDGSSFDVCRKLKSNREIAHIPVLMLSHSRQLEDRLAGFLSGAQCYICKPISIREVVEKIDFFVEKTRIFKEQVRLRHARCVA